jgi:methyltransferase (TIGR00027 family)
MPAISRTAAYVAAGRAVGAREPDPDVCNPDYLAERLLGDPARFDLDLPVMHALAQSYDEAMRDIEVASIVRAMIVRTRFVDAALERAVAAGASQILVLGAGFDSHAYRFNPLLEKLRVFEVDRLATLAFKKERVKEVLGAPPRNLSYVAVDFENENVRGVLSRHGYDFSQRSFVIMEGVTMYLDEATVRDTLMLVASHKPGSSVCFDFVSSVLVESLRNVDAERLPLAARAFFQRFLHLIRDEPWRFGFPYKKDREYIEAFGFEVPEILTIGGPVSAKRYLTRADRSEVGGEALQRVPRPQTEAARERAEHMAYRITEAIVAVRH